METGAHGAIGQRVAKVVARESITDLGCVINQHQSMGATHAMGPPWRLIFVTRICARVLPTIPCHLK